MATATSTDGGTTQTCTSTKANFVVPTACEISNLTVGKTYTVSVVAYTALDAASSASTASSSFVVPDPPVNTSAPAVSGAGGKYAVGTAIASADGSWTGDTITGYSYQWQACTDAVDITTCSNITGAIASSYTPASGDAGKFLRIGVTATNQYGSATAYSPLSASQSITAVPIFTAESATAATVGSPYSYTFAASGYRITYSVASGSLPTGLALNASTGSVTGTPTTAGAYNFVVRATNDSGFTDSSPQSVLARSSQTITFPAPSTQTWSSGGTFAVSATSSSGLPVSFSINGATSSICSVSGTTVTMLTGGTCTIIASQAGDDTYFAAVDESQSVTINTATQTVSFTYTGADPVPYGTSTFSVASMASATSGLTPTFTSSTTSVCTVTSGGMVTLVAQGTCTLDADQAGDARYSAAAAVSQSFAVTRGTTNVVWAPTTAVTIPQSPLTPSSLAISPGGGTISYSVDDATTTGCAVNSSTGELTYSASGTCVVRATSAQTPQWESAFTTVTFTIAKADQVITFPPLPGMVYGDAPFAVTVSAPSANVVLTSTTTAVCTVAGTTVTILRAGECDLTASAAATSAYNAAADVSRSFTVAKAAPTVTWTPTTAITADDTLSFTPSALATTNGGALSYAVDSAGTTGCTVDSSTAVVTYVTSGTCAIRANSAATDDTASGSALVSFVISKATQSITFTYSGGSKQYGAAPIAISATTDAPGRLVTFTSQTPLVCGVTSAASIVGGATGGTISIVGVGTCTIRASQAGDAVYAAAANVEQSFTVAQGTQAGLVFTSAMSGTYDDTLTLATAGGSGTGAMTYALIGGAGTANCTLNTTTGELTFGTAANGTGTCVVRATKAGDTNFSSQSTADTTITVAKAKQSIAFTSTVPTSALPGDTYAVTALATSGNAVDLSVLGGCSLSAATSPATVSFTASGPCMIFANSVTDADYLAAYEESQIITVGSLNQTITFPAITDRAFGSASFSVEDSVSASSGLTVAFSSDDTSVCTVSGSGVITPLAVGTCLIRATQAGNDQYGAASPVLRTFNVYAVTPSRPFIFSASAGDGAITLAFTPPGFTGGAPVTAYELVATPTGAGTVVTDDSCAASPCTINGLVNGVEYTVTVAGINVAGTGLASGASTALTPVTRAAAVSGLTAVPDSTSIALSWTPLVNAQLGGGAFVRYDIYHRPAGGSWPLTADDSLSSQSDDSFVLTGLTNGASYVIKIVAITTANSTELEGNTAMVFEYAATVPDSPVSVVALRWVTDTQALVSWTAPLSDGGLPVTAYSVTTSAGGSCSPSPATDDTCILTGLTLGATITVSVTATNGMGTSVAAATAYTVPGAPPGPTPGPGPGPIPPGPTPTPPTPPGPQPIPGPPPGPGEVEVIVDGKPVPGTTTTPGDGTVTVGGDDGSAGGGEFTLTLSAYMGGQRVPLGPGDVLTAPERSQVQVAGTGYAARSRVSVYIGGSPMVLLGTVTTTASGTFDVRFTLPTSVTAGNYVLQVNGYNVGAKVRSINVGVTVTKAPWIKIKGQRGVERVTVEGLSGEIVEGTTIYPMVKLGKSKRFVKGVGLRKLHADGSFEWQRKVAKGKSIWVYFTVIPVKSNTVALPSKVTRT